MQNELGVTGEREEERRITIMNYGTREVIENELGNAIGNGWWIK